jgi:hypothetical protein
MGMKTMTAEAKLIELKAAYEAHGPKALIDGCSGLTNHIYFSRLWACAMTERYGTTGLHKSWTNADESPSAECLEKFPNVRHAIERARESIQGVWTFIGSNSPWIKDMVYDI